MGDKDDRTGGELLLSGGDLLAFLMTSLLCGQ